MGASRQARRLVWGYRCTVCQLLAVNFCMITKRMFQTNVQLEPSGTSGGTSVEQDKASVSWKCLGHMQGQSQHILTCLGAHRRWNLLAHGARIHGTYKQAMPRVCCKIRETSSSKSFPFPAFDQGHHSTQLLPRKTSWNFSGFQSRTPGWYSSLAA